MEVIAGLIAADIKNTVSGQNAKSACNDRPKSDYSLRFDMIHQTGAFHLNNDCGCVTTAIRTA